jgi:hypothetical protein
MKFRLLLLVIYIRLWWLSHFSEQFKHRISGKSFCFHIGLTDSTVGRSYRLSNGRVASCTGNKDSADIYIQFCSVDYGYRMLLTGSKKPLRFADGMNRKKIVVRGTIDYLFWLMDIGRYLPLDRKSALPSFANAMMLVFSRIMFQHSR